MTRRERNLFEKVVFPVIGITNTICESYNSSMKSYTNRKEMPADVMAIVLYKLQCSSIIEIKRGRAGVGDYHLDDNLKTLL